MENFSEFLIGNNGASDARSAVFDDIAGRCWSYGALRAETARLARLFAEGSAGLFFLVLQNDIEGVLLYLASQAAGITVAIIDPSSPMPAFPELVRRYDPEWCFVPAGWPGEEFAARNGHLVQTSLARGRLWRRVTSGGRPADPPLQILLPTSGSTGDPKFVRLSTANLICNTGDIVAALAIGGDDCAVSSLPLSYSYGLSVLNSHLRAGASIVLTRKQISDPGFWRLVREQRCTSFAGVPVSYRLLRRTDLTALDRTSLRKLTQAGGRLDEDTIRYFHRLMDVRRGEFCVMYGQTEAAPRMTTLRHHDLEKKPGSVGLPMRNGRVWIEGRVAGFAKPVGEIFYAGPNVMMGYAHDRDDLAAGDRLGGVLTTGDLGFIDEEGYLFIAGRLNRIAKVLGRRINLEDIERIAGQCGDCAAVEGNEEVVLYVAKAIDPDQVMARLAQQFGEGMARLRIAPIDSFPVTSNGKIDYAELQKFAQVA